MKQLGKDIIQANETEIVLSEFVGFKWAFRLIGLVLGCLSLGICASTMFGEYAFEGWEMIFVSLCCLVPFAVPAWHFPDRHTTVQFNQPTGFITVIKAPWWSIFIPGGPLFIKTPNKIPLPTRRPVVEDQSGDTTYAVLTGPNEYELRTSYAQRYQVQVPLASGEMYKLWTTNDENTYIEIVRRINEAAHARFPSDM